MKERVLAFMLSVLVILVAGVLVQLLSAIGLATAFGQEQREFDEDSGRTNLFVDAAAPLGGDGSREHPFARITDAVVRARAVRQEDGNDEGKRIVIHVLPGIYVGSYTNTGPRIEPLPIRLDVPRLTLLGSTEMEKDEAGLPTGVITPGSNTLLLADPPLAGLQWLLLVASTSGEVVDRVTIAKLSLDTSAVRLGGGDINVDRAQDFTIRDNYITAGMGGQVGGGQGVEVDRSSGQILGNYVTRVGAGIGVTAGNASSPARVLVSGNRCVNNRSGGVFLLGNPFGNGPPSSEDSLFAVVSGNDLSDNRFTPDVSFGLRIGLISMVDHGSVTATISNNRIRNNNLGVILDAAVPIRTDPRLFTGTLDLTFEDNEIAGNILTHALISFTRFSASLHPDDELPIWKYLQGSVFDIRYSNGELDGYWFDHPEIEPIDGRTLENVLRVNGAEIHNGRFVPFP